jgi:hypothetical protein
MKTVLVIILMFTTTSVFSQDWTSAEARFDASKVMTEKSVVTWKRVPNVQATCERESKNRGLGGFGNLGVQACSFWDKNTCTIITSTRPNLHDLGHEMRHCFQGNYH